MGVYNSRHLAIFVTSPVYYFYKKGPQIRMKSKFAQQVAKDRQAQLERRRSCTAVGADGAGEKSEGNVLGNAGEGIDVRDAEP